MSQTVKLLSSSAQGWSGGVAGRYGCYYHFEIEFTDFGESEPLPDTLWIDQIPIMVTLFDSTTQPYGNTKVRRLHNKLVYHLYGETEHNQLEMYGGFNQHKTPNPYHCPVDYKGVAMISYKYKGKEAWFEVSKITNVLQGINYP